MEKIEINSRTGIDKQKSATLAHSILDCFDGMPMEDCLTLLNALSVALAKLVEEIRDGSELSEEDGLEKLVLSWLSATDVITGNKFSRFVSTDCVELDL